MQSIDKERFIKLYVSAFGAMKPEAQANLNILLAFMVADEKLVDIRHGAYMLATTKHETGHTFAPVEEIGKGKGKPYGKVNEHTGHAYYGRSLVQLTWYENYNIMGLALGIDLVNHPELALKYDVAYQIMSYGMRNGVFTGKKLSKYIHDDVCDYISARRIINGQDCAGKIAGYAKTFESILKVTTT